jgi:hypothetical protein
MSTLYTDGCVVVTITLYGTPTSHFEIIYCQHAELRSIL